MSAEDKPPPSHRRTLVVLLAILAVASLLRAFRLGAKSLWLDEIMVARQAALPTVGAVANEVRKGYDVHPPLYPVTLHLWLRTGRLALAEPAQSDVMVRVPSALFGALAVVLIYLLGARLYGRAVGLLAALLLALSTYHVYYSQEARNYAMTILLTLLLSWLLVIIVKSGERVPRWAWAGYGLVGAACLYTYVMSILVIVSHWAVFLLLARKTRRNLLNGLGVQLCIGVAFLPWLPWLLYMQRVIGRIVREQGGVPGPGVGDVVGAFGQWLFASEFLLGVGGRRLEAVLGAVGLAIIAFAFFRAWSAARRGDAPAREGARAASALALMIFLPLACFLLAPMKRVHQFDPKHLVFIQPLCLVAVAAAIAARGSSRIGRLALLLPCLVAVINAALLPFYFDRERQKERWPEAAAFVASQPAEAVIVNPGRGATYAFTRYYRGPAKVEGPDLGYRLPPGASLTIRPQRLWLVSCRNEVILPTIGLNEYFDRTMELVTEHERYFFGAPQRAIRCALYRRKAAPEATPPPPTAPPARSPGPAPEPQR